MKKNIIVLVLGVLFFLVGSILVSADTLYANETYESNSVVNWSAGVVSSTLADFEGTYGMLVNNDGNGQTHTTLISDSDNHNFTVGGWIQDSSAVNNAIGIGEDANNMVTFRLDATHPRVALYFGGSNNNGYFNTSCSFSSATWYYIRGMINRTSSANNEYSATVFYYDTGGNVVCTNWMTFDGDDANASWVNSDSFRMTTWNNAPSGTYYYDNLEFTQLADEFTPIVEGINITARDEFDNVTLSNWVINISNGSINNESYVVSGAYQWFNISGDVFLNITHDSYLENERTNFSNVSGTSNSTVSAFLYQSILRLNASEIITGDRQNTYGANLSYFQKSTANGDVEFRVRAGNYSVNLSSINHFPVTSLIEVNVTQDKTFPFDYLYNSVLTLNAVDILDNATVENYTARLNFSNWGLEKSTTNGSIYWGILQGIYNLSIFNAGGYALYDQDLINVSSTAQNYTAFLFENNSLWVTAKNEVTLSTITSFNVSLFDANNSYTAEANIGTGSTARLNNIIPSSYTLEVIADTFTTRTYNVTVGSGSHQNLLALLSQNTENVVFTTINSLSASNIEGVSITMSKLINSTWTVVQSKLTDITGRAQFQYTPATNYRFNVQDTAYVDREFLLTPIFESYEIILTPIATDEQELNLDGVNIGFSPTIFHNDFFNVVNVSFNSPAGSLEWYSLNVTFKGQNNYTNGTNTLGGVLSLGVNVSGATINDRLIVRYGYKTSMGTQIFYTRTFVLEDITITGSTLQFNKDNHYGTGELERLILATVISITLAGAGMLAGGVAGGGVMGIMAFSYFTYIGWVNAWFFYILGFIGVIFVFAKMRS